MTHEEAMKDKVYAAFHSEYYHGPAHLNITAMQMDKLDEKKREDDDERMD